MTYYLYRGEWYEIDREDGSTMEPLVEDMLNWGDLEDVLLSTAEEMYGTLAAIVEGMYYDGADRVLDGIMERTMAACEEGFDSIVLPLVDEVREEAEE